MQIEGTKLVFIMNFSVLDFFKFACRMPQIAQIKLVSTFKIFWGKGGVLEISSFFPLAYPGSDCLDIAPAFFARFVWSGKRCRIKTLLCLARSLKVLIKFDRIFFPCHLLSKQQATLVVLVQEISSAHVVMG